MTVQGAINSIRRVKPASALAGRPVPVSLPATNDGVYFGVTFRMKTRWLP